jgi:hypothetical protein
MLFKILVACSCALCNFQSKISNCWDFFHKSGTEALCKSSKCIWKKDLPRQCQPVTKYLNEPRIPVNADPITDWHGQNALKFRVPRSFTPKPGKNSQKPGKSGQFDA